MEYKLLASDMDGTLLDSRSELSAENTLAVKRLVDSGKFFVLTTGRPYQAVTKYVQALNLENMPLILYNGAMVVIGKERVLNLTIPDELVAEIAKIGHDRRSTMICWANDKLYAEYDGEKLRNYMKISDVLPEIIPDLSVLKNVTKFVWYDSPEETIRNYKELSEKYKGKLNVHPSRKDFLEFVNKDCSKAKALEIIAERLSIKRSEIIAVGDGYNDLSMLRWAGLGVAMENAPDEVKNQVGLVSPNNDKNGVKWLIERFL